MSKSGAQVGAENLVKLRSYFSALEGCGARMPMTSNGKANLSAIALACGFERQVLYANPRCRALVETMARKIGMASTAQEPSQPYDQRDVRIRELERRLADAQEKVEALRAENEHLRDYKRLYDLALHR